MIVAAVAITIALVFSFCPRINNEQFDNETKTIETEQLETLNPSEQTQNVDIVDSLLLAEDQMAIQHDNDQQTEVVHTHIYVQEIIESTCTTTGYTRYFCECGDEYSADETSVLEHQYDKVFVKEATCSDSGYTTYQCKLCQDSYNADKTEPTSHKFSKKVIAPTVESKGYTLYTCELCGYDYKDDFKEALPAVNYKKVDEHVYVIVDSLNFRTGPGTTYKSVKTLNKNTKVHRVGIGDNGWSQINIDGELLYASSKYLGTEKVVEAKKETIKEEISRRGNIGRLTIPSLGIDVALFKASIYRNSQSIVDAKDSAAYIKDAVDIYGQILIGDHRHQGFESIKKSVVWSTKAYIDFGTHKKTYICVDKFNGKNTGSDLVDLNGASIAGKNDGGICMYTCNTDGTVTITYWQPK